MRVSYLSQPAGGSTATHPTFRHRHGILEPNSHNRTLCTSRGTQSIGVCVCVRPDTVDTQRGSSVFHPCHGIGSVTHSNERSDTESVCLEGLSSGWRDGGMGAADGNRERSVRGERGRGETGRVRKRDVSVCVCVCMGLLSSRWNVISHIVSFNKSGRK